MSEIILIFISTFIANYHLSLILCILAILFSLFLYLLPNLLIKSLFFILIELIYGIILSISIKNVEAITHFSNVFISINDQDLILLLMKCSQIVSIQSYMNIALFILLFFDLIAIIVEQI